MNEARAVLDLEVGRGEERGDALEEERERLREGVVEGRAGLKGFYKETLTMRKRREETGQKEESNKR